MAGVVVFVAQGSARVRSRWRSRLTRQRTRTCCTVEVGVDPHKHSHTAVAVDSNGGELGQITVGNTAAELIRLLEWAQR